MHNVGLKQAEASSLIEIDGLENLIKSIAEESYIIAEWIKKVLGDTEIFKKFGISNVFYGTSPETPYNISLHGRKSRYGPRVSLIQYGFYLAAASLSEKDPLAYGKEGMSKDILSPYGLIFNTVIYLPKANVLFKDYSPEEKRAVEKYRALKRYVYKLQFLVLENSIPLWPEISLNPFISDKEDDQNPNKKLFKHLVSWQVKRVILDKYHDPKIKLYWESMRDTKRLTDKSSFSKERLSKMPILDLTLLSSIDLTGVRSSGIKSFNLNKEEEMGRAISSKAILYLEEFLQIIKTITRTNEFFSYESI